MEEAGFVKADVTRRITALFIDGLVFMMVFLFLFFWLDTTRYLAALIAGLYVLFRDGLFDGQSIGKRMLNLKTVHRGQQRPANFADSALRNSIFYLPNLFIFNSYAGGIIALVVVGLELYFIFKDEKGLRLGDHFAHTGVTDVEAVPEKEAEAPVETPAQ